MSSLYTITPDEVAEAIGIRLAEMPPPALDRLLALNGRYRLPDTGARDEFLLSILHRLDTPHLARTTEQNLAAFERGWSENLEQCAQEGVSGEALTPRYVKPLPIMRYRGRYIAPEDPYLFAELCDITALSILARYVAPFDRVYEFGCGTGRYLRALSDLYPDKQLAGSDWTAASVKILNLMAASENRRIAGFQFDMLQPDEEACVAQGGAIYTTGAMEQLGARWEPFLQFIRGHDPGVVVHVEPILEFYGDDTLYDYLSATYHRRRNYLCGYWPALQDLASKGEIEILIGRRTHFGDAFNDGSSVIVWRPIGHGG